jgi:hypothetical protein
MKDDRDFMNWLIGFIEGEGCFGFYRQKSHIYPHLGINKMYGYGYKYIPEFRIGLNQKDLPLLQHLYDRFGGYLYKDRTNGCYYWKITCFKKCLNFAYLLNQYEFTQKKLAGW